MNSAWIRKLDTINLLAACDLLIDLQEEVTIAAPGDPVSIPMWKQLIRFPQLHPSDGSQIRDAYCERRFKIASFLQSKGIIKEFKVQEGPHRWDNRLLVEAEEGSVRKTLLLVNAEYKRRLGNNGPQNGAPRGHAPAKQPDRGTFGIVLGVLVTVFIPILQANDAFELNWVLSSALYAAIVGIGNWSLLTHLLPHAERWKRVCVAITVSLVVSGVALYAVGKQYRREHPEVKQQEVMPSPGGGDAPKPPGGAATVTGNCNGTNTGDGGKVDVNCGSPPPKAGKK